MITLNINGAAVEVAADPATPLVYVLRNDLDLKGAKVGCGLEQCGSCTVWIDGQPLPSCRVPIEHVANLPIVTIEGLGSAENPHPMQEAFMAEQAIQCGYCVTGMIMAAEGLLKRVRYPTNDDVNAALAGNLCRCGVHERVRRAIQMRIGRPDWNPIYAVEQLPDLPNTDKTPALASDDLDAWIQIDARETITIFSGKVEIGQGIKTALAQIAAEELDVEVGRVIVVSADTERTPDEGLTAGSMSLAVSGNAIRTAAATARKHLLDLAFETIEAQVPAAQLVVRDGVIRDPVSGRQTDYWSLLGGGVFGRKIPADVTPKPPSEHTIVGQPELRQDLLAKVTGQPSFVHDVDLPDMLHGRVVRPPTYHAKLIAVDEAAVRELPGVVAVVRDGSFLGVLALREEQAIWASERLREVAVWEQNPHSTQTDITQQPSIPHEIINGKPVTGEIRPIATPSNATQTRTATYTRPYQMHGSISPSAAVAQWVGDDVIILSHSQGVFRLRDAIASVLKVDAARVQLAHSEASGCYGHNGADDAALDAALLARAADGRPVSLKWMRGDEHRWEPYGAQMAVQMQGSLDAHGNVIDWNHDVWSYSHLGRPSAHDEHSTLIAAWHIADGKTRPPNKPILAPELGGHRNAAPAYSFERSRIVRHYIPDSPLRSSALRTLGAYTNVFAIESFMDELAYAAGVDPIAFRLRHLQDERARTVIEAAARKANWQPRTQPRNDGTGRGIGYARYKNGLCYAAVIVEVAVAETIQVKRVVIAADAGQIVNPDGICNQLEGGALQSLSWTLRERVQWNEQEILSADWTSYPILRFPDAPHMETELLNRPKSPILGVGEATQGPTAGALANAIFDATGERLRDIPLAQL